MPTLLAEHQVNIEFADLARRRPITRPERPLSRADGVHQSDILTYIARNVTGVLAPGEQLEEEMPWRMALGVMWEEFAFSSILLNSEWQPGERTVDGISINPDGVCLDDQWGVLLDETKHTEKKLPENGNDFIKNKKNWMWQHQGRGYGYGYDIDVVRWTNMYFRGDYAGSGPVCMQYVVQYSKTELRQTWEMELRYKPDVEMLLGMGELTF